MNAPTTLSATSAVEDTHTHQSAFFDHETLPWQPWVMEGTYFRLLDVDPKTGGFTLLLKVDPDTPAPIHGHVGAVQGMIIEGEFSYENDPGVKGNYIREPGGCRHSPKTKEGAIIFAVLHGPLVGYNEDGSPAAIVDGKMMYDMADAAGVAGHINVDFD